MTHGHKAEGSSRVVGQARKGAAAATAAAAAAAAGADVAAAKGGSTPASSWLAHGSLCKG